MSKIKIDKINFDDADFLVEIDNAGQKKKVINKQEKIEKAQNKNAEIEEKNKELEKLNEAQLENFERLQREISQAELQLNRARQDAQEIFDSAQKQASELVENALSEVEAQKIAIIEEAKAQAEQIVQEAKETSSKEAETLIATSKEEIEQERITTIKTAYDEGYKDGLERIQEELEEKIQDLNNFCSNQYEIRDKILKSANKDMLDLILNITKKVLLKELDAQTIEKIIKNAISLLEKKENISIILSEKYARLLFEYQKQSLADDIEFNFEDFKQFENFEIVYNPSFDDDTIIVENLKERYDASINSQLDVIIRNIYDNSQNGKLDLEQYENEAEWTKRHCE